MAKIKVKATLTKRAATEPKDKDSRTDVEIFNENMNRVALATQTAMDTVYADRYTPEVLLSAGFRLLAEYFEILRTSFVDQYSAKLTMSMDKSWVVYATFADEMAEHLLEAAPEHEFISILSPKAFREAVCQFEGKWDREAKATYIRAGWGLGLESLRNPTSPYIKYDMQSLKPKTQEHP